MELTKRIDINVGTRCDLQCRFCYYGKRLSANDRSTRQLKSLLKFVKSKGIEAIDITGGEPLIREDIIELISFARSLKFKNICIITNGQRLADRYFAKEIIEAGVNEILFSIHGHAPKFHDFLTGKDGSFDKLLKAIDNIKILEVPFRTNSVVTRVNYQLLPELAAFLSGLRPKTVNFLLFNPLDDAHFYKYKMMPKYSESAYFIKKAIDMLKGEIKINIRYIPFCFMEGYERFVCNMHQVQYDQDEWDYVLKQEILRGSSARWLHIVRGIFLLPFSRILSQNRSILIHDAFIKSKNLRQNVRSHRCRKCKYDLICDGPWKEYAKLYGFNEFNSIPGEEISDPVFFKYQQKNREKSSIESNKITIINNFPLLPPFAGGAEQRIHRFYNTLSIKNNVSLLFCELSGFRKEEKMSEKKADSIKEDKLYTLIRRINNRLFKFRGLGPITVSITAIFNKRFKTILKNSIKDSDILFMEFPYLCNLFAKFRPNQLLVYDAHNVECIYRKNEISNALVSRSLLPYIRFLENKACHKSDIILTTSEEDKALLAKLYKVPFKKIFVIPNGVDTEEIKPNSDSERKIAKEKLNLDLKRKVILFIGGNHSSNLAALDPIVFDLSYKLPNYIFLIVGGVYEAFKQRYNREFPVPINIKFLSIVSDELRDLILKASDAAINPVTFGSGTNLKMFDYMAAGLPIVTTKIGARGIEAESRKHLLISTLDKFSETIEELFQDKNLYEALRTNARKLAEEKYDWAIISSQMSKLLQAHIVI